MYLSHFYLINDEETVRHITQTFKDGVNFSTDVKLVDNIADDDINFVSSDSFNSFEEILELPKNTNVIYEERSLNDILKKYINTSWDDYYLNPYRFIIPEEEPNIISSPDSLVHIINNLTNSAVNNFNKSNLELTSNSILVNNNKNNDKTFNPLLFKLIANDNIAQLENVLKNKLGSLNMDSITNASLIDTQDKDGDTPLHISVFLANIYAINIYYDRRKR